MDGGTSEQTFALLEVLLHLKRCLILAFHNSIKSEPFSYAHALKYLQF